jgi:hypothetical protein
MWSRPEHLARAGLAIAAVLGALFLPWWVPALCMTLSSLRFPAWEVPLIGLFMDFLWQPADHFALPLFTIFGIIIVWVTRPLRKQLLL